MIKANELRIGNYITVDGNTLNTYQTFKPKKVTVEIIKAIQEENEARPDAELSVWGALPLTTEIFNHCCTSMTFETDPQEVNATKKFLLNGIAIFQPTESINKFYYFNEDVDTELLHVHQLQNLVFALTNQELQINL